MHLLSDEVISQRIHQNLKFWSFFKDTISALDRSHIHATPPAFECTIYHNCKGLISQNCLLVWNFNMNFTCTLTSYEESAIDTHNAYTKDPQEDLLQVTLVLWPIGKKVYAIMAYCSHYGHYNSYNNHKTLYANLQKQMLMKVVCDLYHCNSNPNKQKCENITMPYGDLFLS
ncbi:hypothetical protein C8R48DRAFT_611631 [Suillus tomentosus]|nr:hypothetical protein C8R48DRAFT_611631 [Suillus tomentosus]